MNFTICTNIHHFLSLEALFGLEKLHKNDLTELKMEKSLKKQQRRVDRGNNSKIQKLRWIS